MTSKGDGLPVLEAAYREHSDYVFGVCLKFAGGDRDWALDRTHDVFIRLHDNLRSLETDSDLRPWLRRVAVNECLMDLRKRDRRTRLLRLFGRGLEPQQAAAPPGSERQVALRRDRAHLDVAVAALPAQQRVLLGLMYFEGETLTEAARLIGVSKGQASKLHRRALEALVTREWEGTA